MQELAQILSKLKSMNTTIVVVTHDSELYMHVAQD
ncbi:hypothetical protein [Gardnerella sp. 2492-Sm]